MKATTLKELNDREEIDFSSFIENLKTPEMDMKVREEREPPKKTSIAFRVTPSIPEDDESMDEDEEDEFAMLIRKVGKIFYKKGRMSNFCRSRTQGKSDRRKEDIGPCYNCKKSGYLITDCLSLKATSSKRPRRRPWWPLWTIWKASLKKRWASSMCVL